MVKKFPPLGDKSMHWKDSWIGNLNFLNKKLELGVIIFGNIKDVLFSFAENYCTLITSSFIFLLGENLSIVGVGVDFCPNVLFGLALSSPLSLLPV